LAALRIGAGIAEGAIIPQAQLRQVAAGGTLTTIDENLSTYDSHIAEGYELFDKTSGLSLRTLLGTATADGFAKHTSRISATELTMFGSADSFVFAPNGDDAAFASTVSSFSLRFQLDAPGRFRMATSGFASNAATSVMYLTNANDETLHYHDATDLPSLEVELSLAAGEYVISAEATSSGFLEYGSGQPDGRAEINLSFVQVPEPASVILVGGVCLAIGARARMRRTHFVDSRQPNDELRTDSYNVTCSVVWESVVSVAAFFSRTSLDKQQ
jgi:hypothetical protein